jgi:hypothetical protein
MRKIVAIALMVIIGSMSIANIVEFFEEIPPAVKYAVGTVITVYAVSWAYSWFFDPIMVVADTTYGAYTFGPVIVVSPDIYHHEQETVLNHVLNHEYVHYIQHAIYGPILSLTYPIFYWYSTLKTGNQWDANYWELQAIELSDCSLPAWEPSFVIELE